MRIFKKFPKNSKCPICGTNEEKECVLIGIQGTKKGRNIQANSYHLDCIELFESDYKEKTFLIQKFDRKDA